MPDKPEEVQLAKLAFRQHGVVATRQLVAIGISRDTVWRRVEHGFDSSIFKFYYNRCWYREHDD